MHILHGTWLPHLQSFALWGESALPLSFRAPKRRRVRTPLGMAWPHHFATSQATLLSILGHYAPMAAPTAEDIMLQMPCADHGPVPSPDAIALGAPVPLNAEKASLHPVVISPLFLKPFDALALLCTIPMRSWEHPRFQCGDDLVFWSKAALLTMNYLAEGRYLPGLKREGMRYRATWEPRPEPAKINALAASMPPVCSAVVDSRKSIAQTYPNTPEVLIESFMALCMDSYIRRAFVRKARWYKFRMPHPWLRALVSEDPFLVSRPSDNQILVEAYERWRSDSEGSHAVRVCFRLEEPSGTDQRWWLAYMLQAVDDPSLLIDASQIWEVRDRTLRYLERRFTDPQEKLLTGLGMASRLFAPIDRSLHQSRPNGVALTAEEAYEFLGDVAPLLEQSQFGVLIPNWWNRRPRLKARARVEGDVQPTGILGRDNLLRFEWQMALGDRALSQAEFEELVNLKQPLIRFRGEWVAISPEQIQAALSFFEGRDREEDIGLLDALRLSAEAETADSIVGGLEVDRIDFADQIGDLLTRLRAPDTVPPQTPPTGLHAHLRPYQLRGLGWLVEMRRLGLGACLADDMGLGKTLQQIALWLYEREHLGVSGPALVVCPTSVVGNWRHEIARFAPGLRFYVHQGMARVGGEEFVRAARSSDVVITSYALLSRDLESLKPIEWASVTLDEAQNIKNPSTKAAQAARALKTGHRVALTGTPVENRLSELWSILTFLNPGYLGSREQFRERFSNPIERYGNDRAAGHLRSLIRPFILRRVKTDPTVINDLPDKSENKIYCSLTPEQATLYEAVVRDEMDEIEQASSDMQRRGNILRMLTRLKQICNHPAHFLKQFEGDLRSRSGKLTRLTEMIEEVLDNGEAALIFTQYAEMGGLLERHLREHFESNVLFLHGGTPALNRDEMVQHFQSPFGPQLFILSLRAGGTGLNLTRASHVFHFDRWYNPAVENQATDRAFRIGQTKAVQVYKYICLGTLEERIDDLIERKRDLADKIVGEGESWLSEMSTDELRALVTLQRDEVEAE